MNGELRESVGDRDQGTVNRDADVRTVQGELNMHLVEDHRSDRWLDVNGRMDGPTLSAIDEFQRRHGLARSAVIEPGDKTARALSSHRGPHSMRVSLDLIHWLEGVEGFSPVPYSDAANPLNATIGFGHELHRGPVTSADRERWSRADAESHLRQDLGWWAENDVNRDVRVPLSQDQFDALVSLTFNIGDHAFRHSTLLRLLNAGDYLGAAKEFESWHYVHSNGHMRSLAGLTERRRHEKQIFLNR